ncbi:hypothetical protein BHM03_00047656 [Ensete ventricosum]|nr:hypothetical protein BHM03_00047656 [Ensete ventricosum]
MYIDAPSSSYCSRTLVVTDATCSHEVTPQPQPDKLFLKYHIQLNQLWFLMQCSLTSGYFHDFTEERTMILKIFPDDDLRSMAHDRKKEPKKGIHMTPTTMMSSISRLALPECGNVFVLRADTSRVGIRVTLMQDGPWHKRGVSPKELQSMLTPAHTKKKWPPEKLQNGRKVKDRVFYTSSSISRKLEP